MPASRVVIAIIWAAALVAQPAQVQIPAPGIRLMAGETLPLTAVARDAQLADKVFAEMIAKRMGIALEIPAAVTEGEALQGAAVISDAQSADEAFTEIAARRMGAVLEMLAAVTAGKTVPWPAVRDTQLTGKVFA